MVAPPRRVRSRRVQFETLDERLPLAGELSFIEAAPGGDPVYGTTIAAADKLIFADTSPTRGWELRIHDPATQVTTEIEINPGIGDSYPGRYGGFAAVGTQVYFTAYDDTRGMEMRRIDAALAAPQVETISTGSNVLFEQQARQFVTVGSKLFFIGYHRTLGSQLMWIDTAEAVATVRALNVAPSISPFMYASGLGVVGNLLFFHASTGNLRWIDTTLTVPTVNTINVEPALNSANPLSAFTTVGTKLYFPGYDSVIGTELRWIDTAVSMTQVSTLDIYSGSLSSGPGATSGFALFGSKLFFSASTAADGLELRWIDTSLTTPTLQTISVASGSSGSDPGKYGLAVAGNKLYFTATSAGETELRWIDASLANPPVQKIDIYAGFNSSDAGKYGGLRVAGNKLFFTAADAANGHELRWIDVTAASPTVNTISLRSGTADSFAGQFGGLTIVGPNLYFTAVDSSGLLDLRWLTVANPSGGVQTIDISAAGTWSFPGERSSFAVLGSNFFYSYLDPTKGRELAWVDLASPNRTLRLFDINPGSNSSEPGESGAFQVLGSRLYFAATNGSGRLLHWIDTAATVPTVNSVNVTLPGWTYDMSDSRRFGLVGTKLYFQAPKVGIGEELAWIDTAEATPTVQYLDIYPGFNSSEPGEANGFIAHGTKLFFHARTATEGVELRWIDTAESTPIVRTVDINPGTSGSANERFHAVIGSKLFFGTSTSARGNELGWIDMALDTPTANIIDIVSGANGSWAGRYGFAVQGTKLYFPATTFNGFYRIFEVDASVASPSARLIDLGELYGLENLTFVDSKLYFSAQRPSEGFELRWIDPAEPTPLLHTVEVAPGTTNGQVGQSGQVPFGKKFAAIGTSLYFYGGNTTTDIDLWTVNAKLAPNSPELIDINSGLDGSHAGYWGGFVTVDDQLLFAATKAGFGRELFVYVPRLPLTATATPQASGVRFTLSQPIGDPTTLNLYDYHNASGQSVLGPADVKLVNSAGQTIPGSLIIAPGDREFTFVATAGLLPADTYTLTVRSGSDGFHTVAGEPLDGDNNGLPGGDFVTTFTIAVPPANAVTVSVPHIARGPEQAVHVPADTTLGLPVSLSNGDPVTSLAFDLRFDPGLLNVTGVVLPASAPAGSTANLTSTAAGHARITLSFTTPLAAGAQVVAYLQATVPSSAAARYGEREVLDVGAIDLRNGDGLPIPAFDQDAVHVNTYSGDFGRNGRYDSFDVQQASRLALRLDTGLGQHALLDPVVLGDFNGNRRIDSFDVQRISRLALRLSVAEVAALPSPTPTVTDTDRLADEPIESAPPKAAVVGPRSDIDGNGAVDVQDVLWAVYYFNRSSNGASPTLKLDVNGDQQFDSADVLYAVVDFRATQSTEGEPAADDDLHELTLLLAADAVAARKKK